ncbi:MAG: NUDIX hydrolase [Burkholderiales bacterium]|nr:NUDIX hydrolase [Phycisphaerae bacterium]
MDFEVVEKQVLFTGKKIRLELHHLRGSDGSRHKREICVHPGAVVILPIMEDDTVLMIRNFRYTVQEYLLELPAGTLEPKEDPINCAGRELLEETGYLAGKLVPLKSFYASPGILTERMHTFLATRLTRQTTQLDEGEQIELMPMKFADCIDAIRTGLIVDSKTIATLLLYERFYRGTK